MTSKEMRLAAYLLEMASDTFANHGCNDMERKVMDSFGFTDAEKMDFARGFHEANGDLDEVESELSLRDFYWLGDSTLMSYMAKRLLEDA